VETVAKSSNEWVIIRRSEESGSMVELRRYRECASMGYIMLGNIIISLSDEN
jgi:hypothetical protein